MKQDDTYCEWQTPEQRKVTAEHRAHDNRETRRRCNLFFFWRACGEKRCRRAQACVGEPHACFQRHWDALTEEQRHWRRALLLALVEGMPILQAIDAANAETARFVAFTQKLGARTGSAVGP